MRRAAVFAVLAGTVLLAAACGEKAEPTGAHVKLFPVTVSAGSGSPLILDRAPERVATLGAPAAALVSALEKGAATRPTILNAVSADQLSSFHPDLVISAGAGPSTQGPEYVLQQDSITSAERGIVDVGSLLGRPLQARAMLERIEGQRRTVERKVGSLPRMRVFLDTGFFITVPTHSLAGDILSQAGGRSVAGQSPGPGPYDLRLLRRKNPDFYLATSDSGITLKDLRRNPRTRSLRAVRLRHFGIIPASYLQAGPDIGAGLFAVAKLLHPNAFR
jgi:ABC-type Fe3+-hydroxamate transport system substrate-binding protein